MLFKSLSSFLLAISTSSLRRSRRQLMLLAVLLLSHIFVSLSLFLHLYLLFSLSCTNTSSLSTKPTPSHSLCLSLFSTSQRFFWASYMKFLTSIPPLTLLNGISMVEIFITKPLRLVAINWSQSCFLKYCLKEKSIAWMIPELYSLLANNKEND